MKAALWERGIIKEILTVLTVCALFLSAACIGRYEIAAGRTFMLWAVILADLFLAGYWIGVVFRWMRNGGFFRIPENKGILIAMLFTFLSRLTQLTDMPLWDSLVYYKQLMEACQSFDFTAAAMLRFALADHPSIGYAGITAIGEFLFPGEYYGVLLVWMTVTVMTAGCLYRILEKAVPHRSGRYYTISTCMVMSTPLVLGLFSYYLPDAGTVCFFVFVLYCYLYKKNILMLFSMSLLVLSKEVGCVAIAGFCIGLFLGQVLVGPKRRRWERFAALFRNPVVICGLLAFGALGIYLLFFWGTGGHIWSYGHDKWYLGFGFDPDFVLENCGQFFVLNYNWLIWGGNLICLILLQSGIFGRKKKGKVAAKRLLFILTATAVTLMLFYSVYLTFAIPRYHVLIDFLGVMILVIYGGILVPESAVRYNAARDLALLVLGGILLLEAYIPTDPLSIALFSWEGDNRYHFMGPNSDQGIHNHQYNYLNRTIDQVLRDTGYHEGMDVLTYDSIVYYGVIRSGEYYWDTVEKKRVLLPNENTIAIKGIMPDLLRNGSIAQSELSREALYISPVQYGLDETYEENFLAEYQYTIRYKGVVKIPFCGETRFMVCDRISGEE